jgi:hypothetical protein
LIRFRRASNTDSDNSAKSKERKNNKEPRVVLKKHVIFDEDFTSLGRSTPAATPEFYLEETTTKNSTPPAAASALADVDKQQQPSPLKSNAISSTQNEDTNV